MCWFVTLGAQGASKCAVCTRAVQVEEVGKVLMSLEPIFEPANFKANMRAIALKGV